MSGATRGAAGGAIVAAAAAALLGVRVATGFDGFFLDDDVLNMRWVLEHRDAPWAALTERHALHDHIRPLNLLAHWLGAAVSDGAWWGPHAVLVALYLLAVAGAAALAGVLALRERRALTTGIAALLVASLPAGAKLLGWNAWMGSAGELACGLWAVVVAVRALGEGRTAGARRRGLVGAGLLVVAAGLFKEPGWIVYPAAIAAAAAFAAGPAGRRAGIAGGFSALGAAGLAFVWHPANAGHYAAGGTPLAARAGDALAMYARSTGSAWPVGEGGGVTIPALLLAVGGLVAVRPTAREAVRLGAVPIALAAVGLGVMLPNPDLHPVHLLPAAVGVAVLAALGLGAMPARGILGGFALVGVLAWQVAATAPSVEAAPPLRAEEVLKSRLLGLAALVRGARAQAVAIPPGGDDAAGEGAYVREATRFLVPYTGAPAEGEGAGASRRGGSGMPLFTEGAVLRVPPDAERWAMDRNGLARYGARLENGPPAAIPAPAGTYAIGASHRGGAGTDAAMVASDACGARWEAPATSDERRLVLLPLQVGGACLPLSVGVDKAITTDVFFLLVPLDPPRLSLWDAPTEALPTLLDVSSRVATPTPLPSFAPAPGGR